MELGYPEDQRRTQWGKAFDSSLFSLCCDYFGGDINDLRRSGDESSCREIKRYQLI